MTAPNHKVPDGAYVIGEDFGQGISKDAVKPLINGKATDMLWQAAAGIFKMRETVGATQAEHFDGQNALRARMDLLREVSGYGAAFMGMNWAVPTEKWVVMPFDTGLGPAKGVEVKDGGLVLKKGGLWRIDLHGTSQGYTECMTMNYQPATESWWPQYWWAPIKPTYQIEVLDPAGKLHSSRQLAAFANVSYSTKDAMNFPLASAFSHTFVLPELPVETAPDASKSWYRVRVGYRFDMVAEGMNSNVGICKVLGGTRRSALTASRWSHDVANLNYKPTVPDGGTLG